MQTIDYLQDLIRFDSVSLKSNVAITDYVQEQLRVLGFETERLEYDDRNGVRKASVVGKKGDGVGGMAYFGHTDVVPADTWKFDDHGPFEPTVKDDRLYGRGSCDMKGSVACMLGAAAQAQTQELSQPIYVVCTSDEEVGYLGAAQVAAESQFFAEMVEHDTRGIIGEPTTLEVVHAHKGVCGFTATARGVAAHSSTREGVNANLAMIPFLVEMKTIHDETQAAPEWQNDEFDPPTISWNIGINDHTRAVNITPPQSICTVYFRPMPGQNVDILIERVRAKAAECGLEFDLRIKGSAMYIDPGSDYVRECLELAGREQPETVSYGTDGAMLGALKKLVVCGPGSIAQAHTRDEWIALEQLDAGTDLYARMIREWCG